jgi:hypothetical protein
VASVDAQFTADDVLAIETENVDGFTITLTRARPVRVTVDGRAIKSKAAKMLSFVKDARGWRPGLYTPKGKGPGAEGPISAAVSDRHIYVYGTADSPAPEERKRRREQAEAAAEWSTRRLPLLLTFRTMADSEVKESDLKVANLFLFGTKETNSLIARFVSSLPLAMNAGAADFGLLFIAPVGARYVVVNSGLSWWEGLERTDRLNRRYYPRAMALWSFGDYILFKGSLDRVVAEGLFDSQWRVPAEQATLLTNSGAVQVRK